MAADPSTSPLWPADNPAVIAHVATLQGIITRLAGSSANCKTWCLTVVSALLALGGTLKAPEVGALAILPLWIFALLDALYLAQEREYRRLLDGMLAKVRDGSYARADAFSVAGRPRAGDLLDALRSWSILPIYGTLLLGVIILTLAQR